MTMTAQTETEVAPPKKALHRGQRVAILDAGAQYLKVIDRKVRALNVYTDILPIDTPVKGLADYDAVIISGGPSSVYESEAPHCDPKLFTDYGKPVLGICYGMQEMAHALGGRVESLSLREDGPGVIVVDPSSQFFRDTDTKQYVLMSHGDSVTLVPQGFGVTAQSGDLIAAMEDSGRNLYGVQFHPEVDLTEHGQAMLHRFLFDIAGLTGDYTPEDFIAHTLQEIRHAAGSRHVLVLASGGVDSTVMATLVGKAINPNRVHVVHIDTGFMRAGESRLVQESLASVDIAVDVVDASREFFAAVGGLADPEAIRTAIGDTFMAVVDREIERLGLDPTNCMLAQGTLRPDLIESASSIASGRADRIKTHHNDSPRVRVLRQQGMVIEPLKELHKDQVRAVGERLGLPREVVWRHPFPGPGLAIRIRCSEAQSSEQWSALTDELKRFDTQDIQVILVPVSSVGVQGDVRTFKPAAGLVGKENWTTLYEMAREIPKRVKGVNRVVYIFGPTESHQGATPTDITPDVIEQLRTADEIVHQTMIKWNVVTAISQFPVILIPLHFGVPGNRSIVLRPFMTNDFMTGKPAIPGVDIPVDAIREMVERLKKEVPGISNVLYDLTTKPPGTTEWE